jgi:predicted nucleotidyltransferase
MQRLSLDAFTAELDRIVTNLRPYTPEKVILFGSFARGDYHAGSDVDLLIIKNTDHPFLERSADVLRLCQSQLAIEPLVYTPTEFERMLRQRNPFIWQVITEGRIIYEQQPG